MWAQSFSWVCESGHYFSHLESLQGQRYLHLSCGWRVVDRRAASLSGRNMSKVSQWGIAAGVLIAFVGLIAMAAGFASRQTDPAPVAAGLAIFALGLLSVAASFYFQARSIKSQLPQDASVSAAGRRKPSCDVCRKAPAVIQCTMHKTSLCSTCLSAHYESRGCVYVPSVRRTSGKSSRSAAASHS